MSSVSSTAGAVTAHRPASSIPFTATLRSEWYKLVTVRSTWISAVLALLLSVGMTTFVAWVTGWSWSDWSAGDRASFDPVTFTFTGLIFGGIILVVIGVNLVASEYSSGMISQTFTTTPKRGRVLAAKLIVVTAFTLVLTAIMFVAMFYAAQAVFRAYDLPTVGLGEPDSWKAAIGVIATSPVFPIIGVAAAFALRSAAGAITLVLGLLFLPSMFGALLPRRWQENVIAYLPGNLADSVALGHLPAYSDNPMYKDQVLAGGLLLVWMAVLIVGTLVLLNRRDV